MRGASIVRNERCGGEGLTHARRLLEIWCLQLDRLAELHVSVELFPDGPHVPVSPGRVGEEDIAPVTRHAVDLEHHLIVKVLQLCEDFRLAVDLAVVESFDVLHDMVNHHLVDERIVDVGPDLAVREKVLDSQEGKRKARRVEEHIRLVLDNALQGVYHAPHYLEDHCCKTLRLQQQISSRHVNDVNVIDELHDRNVEPVLRLLQYAQLRDQVPLGGK